MEPHEYRDALLCWLYDQSLISTLPKSETSMLNGLRRQGTEIELPALREAVDYWTDLKCIDVVKGSSGGGRSAWTWRINATGKQVRESQP